MNALGLAFLVVASILLMSLPRRLAALPLLLSAAYMTYGQIVNIGPAHFTILRMLVVVGFLRVLFRGEHLTDGFHTLDKLVLLWAMVLLAMSPFHEYNAFVYRAGIIWTELGCYFLFRIFLQNLDDVRQIFLFLCAALIPLALMMLAEKFSGHNPFGSLGGVVSNSLVRDGHIRAAGPFSHPILAGTVGAVVIAMGVAVWKTSRRHGLAGVMAGVCIVFAATSSGPILTVLFTFIALIAWRFREHMRAIRWAIFGGLIALDLVMKDPVYFLMARIDISGGSQGYHRAQLIRSSIEHLPEWWATGTDYTRHWMATGIYANDRNSDITNHILGMGVLGGLPLLIVFLVILVYAFRDVGRALQQHCASSTDDQFFIWALGAVLFGFLMTFLGISLFDQSVVYFWLCLAAIQSIVRQPSANTATQRRAAARGQVSPR